MPNGAASGRAPRWPRAWASRSTPATASTMPARKRSPRCPKSSSSTSGISWSARRCSSGSTKRSRPCAAPWSAAAPGPADAMILGIGSDITDMRRIAKVIERHGERFLDRVFTPTERARAERRRNRVETYAKRFAAKEACAKALGTGMRAGVWWRDMGVVNLPRRAADHAADRRRAAPAAGDHAARPRSADRSHHHRRRPDGAGLSWSSRRCRRRPAAIANRPGG